MAEVWIRPGFGLIDNAKRRRLWSMVMDAIIREAIRRDPRSDYQLARDCGLAYSIVRRFTTGERPGITIQIASKICEQLGLELRPVRSPRRRGK